MQNDNSNTGIFSRLPKPSLRQRRMVAMTSAAAIVVVGMKPWAFSQLLPPVLPSPGNRHFTARSGRHQWLSDTAPHACWKTACPLQLRRPGGAYSAPPIEV